MNICLVSQEYPPETPWGGIGTQTRIKARALTAETTASTGIVATMPLVAALGLFVINPEVMSVLFVDPRGRFMLAIAVVSLVLGIAVMKAMISRSLR